MIPDESSCPVRTGMYHSTSMYQNHDMNLKVSQTDRQTTSFIDKSIEAGILLGEGFSYTVSRRQLRLFESKP